MRSLPAALTLALLSLAPSAQAQQRSLFDQAPADPSAGFSSPAAGSPAPAPTLSPRPAPAPVPAAAPAPPQAAAPPPATTLAPSARPAPSRAAARPAARTRAVEAEPAEDTPKPKAKARPRGPQPAGALTIVNGSTATIVSIEIMGGAKPVMSKKPIAPGARALVKLSRPKGCTVTVLATFDAGGPGSPGEVDVCKDKVVRLTDEPGAPG